MSLGLPVHTTFSCTRSRRSFDQGAAVSFTSRNLVRSPFGILPRLARPCTDRQMEPSYKKEPKPFCLQSTVRRQEPGLGLACIFNKGSAATPGGSQVTG